MRRLELVSVTGEVLPLDREPFYAAPDVTLSGMPRVLVSSHTRLGGGRRVTRRAHDSRDVPLRLVIAAESADRFDDAVGRLARAVDPRVGDVTVRFYRDDGSAREVLATYVDGFLNLPLAWSGARETSAPLVFEAFEPYWQSLEDVEYDILASEYIGGGEPTPFASDIPFASAIPFNGFNETGVQRFSIDLAGDVEAHPRWTIVGPGSDIQATNITTGQTWSYTPALGVDRELILDAGTAQVTLDEVNVFSSLSDESELWSLVPGRNHIQLRVQNWSAGSSSKLLLSWRERYLTC